jgi:hypothetical protein
VDANDYIEEENDPVLEQWGLAVNTRGHVPFYRQLYFPDVYELRQCGYDIRRFEELFDLLENARISHARKIHSLLHVEYSSTVFDPNIAKQYELNVWATLHRFGASDAPPLLKKVLGQAFPGESVTHYASDLMTCFFWSSLAMMARDYVWRAPELELMADYLDFPLKAAFGIEALLLAA